MKAIEIAEFGPPDVLHGVDRPTPNIRDDEVLIQVEAAGVSRPDVLQRRGHHPPPPGASDIPGLEVAGTIAAVGAAIAEWNVGDRVVALVAGGGYAQLCAAPAVQVLPIPETWTAQEAAILPENLFTVYDMLIRRMKVSVGETVLIHGGAGGIGSMAIMVARSVGAIVIATAGTEEKCAAALALGAHHAIDYRSQDFVEEAMRFTGERGVDAVLDIIGGSYLDRNLRALAVEGRLGMLATQGGAKADIDLGLMLPKRVSLFGAAMRGRSPALKGEIARDLRRHIWPLLDAKSPIQPIIDRTYPLEQAADAHRRMESGEHIGKIVLTV